MRCRHLFLVLLVALTGCTGQSPAPNTSGVISSLHYPVFRATWSAERLAFTTDPGRRLRVLRGQMIVYDGRLDGSVREFFEDGPKERSTLSWREGRCEHSITYGADVSYTISAERPSDTQP